MTTTQRAATVNPNESIEEFVNQVAHFDNLATFWFHRPSGGDHEVFQDNWTNAMSCLDTWVEYMLALRERMVSEGRYYVGTLTHEATWDVVAQMPKVRRKLA